ncbi:MAG: XRE family transcriptional regulator [Xanthomonadaceae bacterium]|nr:XRE family transcriptional regulator [Xanthomonadaceae bacterium]MDE2249213.1 XRE family transcriptional regulator [Xanthomonadaceae bacterium]
MAKKNIHIGSSFDDFLADDGQLEDATAVAIKRVITWQFEQAMKLSGISKTTMAERMHTSRAALARLLDENDTGLTLDTLSRGAQALGYRVKVELVAA